MQMLKAYSLFEKDRDYIVQEGKVMIVDENTGRVMHGRRWSDGLHQAVEVKENVKVEALTQTYATITLQNYFRMYSKLAGMTGTAETEANEFYEIYKLDVVVIPTNRAIVRKDEHDKVFKTRKEKFNAIVQEIKQLSEAGRPVLVGTTSVENSEQLSRFLNLAKVKHNVLNAKNHAREAEIVAEAGQAPEGPDGKRTGNVTIATNMAGRGTDIKLGAGVREAGGLAIIGTERHESRRVDRQLRGRAGRQGDPGSSQFFVSLEDDLMRMFGSERIAKVMNWMKVPEGEVIQHRMISRSIENAQKKVEENHFSMRKRLLEYDDVMNKQREVIYTRRRNALYGDRIRVDLDHLFEDVAYGIAETYAGTSEYDMFQLETMRMFSLDPGQSLHKLQEARPEAFGEELTEQARSHYRQRTELLARTIYADLSRMAEQERVNLGAQFESQFLSRVIEIHLTDRQRVMRFFPSIREALETEGRSIIREFEKSLTLSVIDDHWKEHLRQMDDLRQSVQTAVFEQKDPLLVYKKEAYNIFMEAVTEMNREIVSFLTRAELPATQNRQAREAPVQRRQDMSKLKATHSDAAAQQGNRRAPVAVPTEGGGERVLSRAERRHMERQEAKRKK
jgi:preprotein translocase subunit SecA